MRFPEPCAPLRTALLSALLCLGAALASADEEAPYLHADQVPDGVAILPPPPAAGSAAARSDQSIFASTRKLQGTPRWQVATDDVSNDPLDRYACALGAQLTRAAAPALAHLLDRAGTGPLVDAVKEHYHSRRPFVGTSAPICEAKTEHLVGSPDYPSGHAANGWLEALILASIAPQHSSALLARGRAYGQSRVVCGSHSASAVQAGWMAGSVMFTALDAQSDFRRDLETARRELARVSPGAPHPDADRCAAEQTLLAGRPW